MGKTLSVELQGRQGAVRQIKDWFTGKEKLLNQAILEAGYNIEAKAKMYVRVDTGRLRGSINTTWVKGGIFGGRIIQVQVGTNLEYAFAQEFGIPGQPNYGYTPFLLPAYEEERPLFLNTIKQLYSK